MKLIVQKYVGKVKWFDPKKGYGFIHEHNYITKETEFYIHYSNIISDGFKTLSSGDLVEFDLEHNGIEILVTNLKILEKKKKFNSIKS